MYMRDSLYCCCCCCSLSFSLCSKMANVKITYSGTCHTYHHILLCIASLYLTRFYSFLPLCLTFSSFAVCLCMCEVKVCCSIWIFFSFFPRFFLRPWVSVCLYIFLLNIFLFSSVPTSISVRLVFSRKIFYTRLCVFATLYSY